MEITVRGLWTLVHGMGFGALYLLACSGALVELYRFSTSSPATEAGPGKERFLRIYVFAMVVLAWASVLTGAYADLSVVSDSTAAGDDRPCDVSATPADGEFHDYRLALPWDGVEGACRLVRSIALTMVAFVFSSMAATSRTIDNYARRCSALP